MKTLCIIQARMGSKRLPGKVLMKIARKPLLSYVLNRVKKAKKIDKIVVATTLALEDDKIEEFCKEEKIDCFRGSIEDVLDRFYKTALRYKEYEAIVRVTGDCPLIDPLVIDAVAQLFEESDCDYVSNVLKETFPDGMDVEVFKKSALVKSRQEAKLKSEREHVTLHIRNDATFSKMNLESGGDYGSFRFTVDNKEDFEVIKFIIENTTQDFSYKDYTDFILKHPEVMKKNTHIKRNEGLAKSLKEDNN